MRNTIPSEEEICPPLSELTALNDKPESEWPTHIKTCEHCSQIMRLLQDTSGAQNRIAVFLSRVKADEDAVDAPAPLLARVKADAGAVDAPAPLLANLRAFFSIGGTKWSVAALAMIVVLLCSVSLQSRLNLSIGGSGGGEQTKAAFERDDFAYQVEPLRDFYIQLQTNDQLTPNEINDGLKTYNQKVSDLNRAELNENQRAEVANLTTQVAAALKSRQQEIALAVKPTPGAPSPVVAAQVQLAGDSQKAADLYVNTGASYADYKGMGFSKRTDDLEDPNNPARVQALQSAFGEIRLVSLGNDWFVVRDLKPDRDQNEKEALIKGIQVFASKSNVKVEFKSGTDVKNITPGAASTGSSKPVSASAHRDN